MDYMASKMDDQITGAQSENEALRKENEELRQELREAGALRDRLADLLSRTAIALRGPEPPLTKWSWHDLPERAAAAIAAIDVMQRAAAINHAPPNTQGNRTNPRSG